MLDSNKRGKIIDDNISRFNKYFTFNPYDYLLRSKGEYSRRNLDSLTDSKTLRRLSLRSSCSLRERFFTKPFMQSLFYYSHIPRSCFVKNIQYIQFSFSKKERRERNLSVFQNSLFISQFVLKPKIFAPLHTIFPIFLLLPSG